MKRAFRFLFVSILVLSSICFDQTTANAHPPRSVVITLTEDGKVGVTVDHNVSDSAKHYIYRILLFANNSVVAQREFSSQPVGDSLTEYFDIGQVAHGTLLSAEAFCVIMGSASGSYRVE